VPLRDQGDERESEREQDPRPQQQPPQRAAATGQLDRVRTVWAGIA